MPHLRLHVPEEWLREDFRAATGFDAKALLDHLVKVVAGLRMENPAVEARRQEIAEAEAAAGKPAREIPAEELRTAADGSAIAPEVVFINLSNLKHAIIPLYYAHTAGDPNKRFLHCTLACGNETLGRTAAVRRRVAHTLGDEIDAFVGDLKGLASVTAHVQDIDRDRGYSTTQVRKKRREGK